MCTTPTHPPSHTSHHRRTISIRTFDTALKTTTTLPPSPQPSTASSQSSFSTAHSTLDTGAQFRYYLPHISTDDEAVYTLSNSHVCNLSPVSRFRSRPPVHFGHFYHYVPDLWGEDVYTDGRGVVDEALRGREQQFARSESALAEFKDVEYDDGPGGVSSPISYIGPKDFAYRPEMCVEAVDVDVGNHAVGVCFGSVAVVDAGGRKGKSSKDRHRRSISLAGMSGKIKEMLRRLHLERKVDE
ncbi:uncharacterized protein M421DRAFT_95266 [Didymella exigua CBS 183.55]|uniref:Uncharacterized protein n=1 Tax=Didymella exigua CBS 183.55 TaxID=1150837 RepID=A0A6A5RC14_9PLEO|nr:uncharacterized protein M421DRAFT_95266 [Didymella exigua CBS 183.55]KAF1924728.1 hypothetical protein M421DRAFT_95266 [Didymella exigua CBS 183.55]